MSNTYTDNLQDGVVLTDAQLNTALTTLQLSLANSALLTSSGTAGQFLKVSTPGSAAVWADTPDQLELGPRDYGLQSYVSSSQLVIKLKNKSGGALSTTNYASVTFPSTSASSCVPIRHNITSTIALSVAASASLGVAFATSADVYVYAIATSTSASGVKLAVSCDPSWGRGNLATTVAMTSGADTKTQLYASAVFSSKPAALLGCVRAVTTSGGAWSSISQVRVQDKPTADDRNNLYDSGAATTATSGVFVTTSSSFVDVTGLSLVLPQTGRPTMLVLDPPAASSVQGYVGAKRLGATGSARAVVQFFSASGSVDWGQSLVGGYTNTSGVLYVAPGSISAIIPAQTKGSSLTVKVRLRQDGGGNEAQMVYCGLKAIFL